MSGTHNRTNAEIELAAQVIRETFDSGKGTFPPEIFYAISETALLSTVELIIVNKTNDEVLLTQRDDDDAYFPSVWHLPGVIVTRGDITNGPSSNAYDNAAVRAYHELRGTQITRLMHISGWINQHPRISRRGPEAPILYGAYLIDEQPNVGQMFDVNHLPRLIHEQHTALIQQGPQALAYAHARAQL